MHLHEPASPRAYRSLLFIRGRTDVYATSPLAGRSHSEVIRGDEMVRAKPACRSRSASRVLMSSSLTLCPSRSDAQFSRSHFGVQNGAPRRHAGAELCGRDEGELARAQRSCPLRTYVCLPPASPRSAHPSMKSRVTLACFVHRSVHKVAIAAGAAWWTFSSAGRACS